MKTTEAGVLVGRLRAAAAGRSGERAGDGELLARFVRLRDEAAFAALVRRHGAMVLGVARRQLREPADAEDVLQATFLLLARRAGAIRRPDSVGCWLYGVALRLARRSRVTTARRRLHETRAGRADRVASNRSDPPAELSLREARLALDEELSRLPEKYRSPLVLCCLEGRTRDEAAGQLGWAVGLLKSRLEQARKLLHRRLVRRGLSVSGVLAAGLFAEVAASAALTRPTVRAVLRAGGASPGARALAEGWGGLMSAKARAAVALPLLAVLSASAGLLFLPAANSAGAPPEASTPAPEPGAKAEGRVDRLGDPLPAGALVRFGTVRYRSGADMHASALSPDGNTLAVSARGDITLWDVASGRPRHRLRDATVAPDFSPNQTLLAFSPDGKRLASIGGWTKDSQSHNGNDRPQPTLQLWDVATATEVLRLDPTGGTRIIEYYMPVRSVWFSPDGKEIGVMLHNGVARFLDAATGAEVRALSTGKSLRWDYPGVAHSPDGKLLAVVDADADESFRLFDVATGREVRRVTAAARLGQVAFAPDSATLAAADDASQVRLFDVATGKESKQYPVAASKDDYNLTALTSLAFSPDGKVLYGGSVRGQILRWRVPEGEVLPALPAEEASGPPGPRNWVMGLHFPPGGRTVVALGGNGLIRRWDVSSNKEIPATEGFTGYVLARLTPDGRFAAIGDSAGRLELFDTATGRSAGVVSPSGPAVSSLLWSPDGKLLAVGRYDDSVTLWDAAGRREVRVIHLPPPEQVFSLSVVAFSPDGRNLLTSQRGLRWWDVATGKELWYRGGLYSAALSPDGKTIAAAGEQNALSILDASTGDVRVTRKQPLDLTNVSVIITAVAFEPSGKGFVTVHSNGAIFLRDPRTGEERRRIRPVGDIQSGSVTFSPDGKWLLSGWSDSAIRILEVSTGKELLRLTGHEGPPRVEFGPGLRTALSASTDSTALVWDLERRAGDRAPPPATCWDDLASDDGSKVYRATRGLVSRPGAAAALLRDKLPPARALDEKHVRQVVARLDADAFADREKATRELTALGAAAVPLLKKLQAENRSQEVQSRLQGVVDGLANREAADYRLSRAVQVLELAATPEALQLLRDWSAGASTVALGEEARAALSRLERADRIRRSAGAP
jgi:RNA polymerase sigma factor (sigma-70 family)